MPTDESQIVDKAVEMKHQYNIKNILITRGHSGCLLIDENDETHCIPTPKVNRVDVTGAGDTTIATLAVSLAKGLPLVEAATIANKAAALKVSQKGTGKVTWAGLGV